MIILIIGLATLATFGSWMLLSSKALRYGLGLLSLLVLAGSVYPWFWQLPLGLH